jgi:hypothetical protein
MGQGRQERGHQARMRLVITRAANFNDSAGWENRRTRTRIQNPSNDWTGRFFAFAVSCSTMIDG